MRCAASFLPTNGPQKYCAQCLTADRQCVACGETFTPSRPQYEVCSHSCGMRARKHAEFNCDICGERFKAKAESKGQYRYCGDKCRERGKRRLKKDSGRLVSGCHRRRARKHGAQYEVVSPIKVFERDRWRCQLCGRKVKRDADPQDDMRPSLDHKVPLSLGGDHTYANVQLAHRGCNVRKGARGGGEQLSLIG